MVDDVAVSMPGSIAWRLAIRSALLDPSDTAAELDMLRDIAGYEAR